MASQDVGAHVPIYTQCQLENHSGGDFRVQLDSAMSWDGFWYPPETIQVQNSGNFKHYSDAEGSIAGAAYTVASHSTSTDRFKWVIAWWNSKESHNKVYTKILDPKANVDWNTVYNDLRGSRNQSEDRAPGFLATATIEDGGKPKMNAKLENA